jgi:hypothetical protein
MKSGSFYREVFYFMKRIVLTPNNKNYIKTAYFFLVKGKNPAIKPQGFYPL